MLELNVWLRIRTRFILVLFIYGLHADVYFYHFIWIFCWLRNFINANGIINILMTDNLLLWNLRRNGMLSSFIKTLFILFWLLKNLFLLGIDEPHQCFWFFIFYLLFNGLININNLFIIDKIQCTCQLRQEINYLHFHFLNVLIYLIFSLYLFLLKDLESFRVFLDIKTQWLLIGMILLW